MADYLFTPSITETFSGQLIYPITLYKILSIKRIYIESVSYIYESKYTSKMTGLEKVNHIIHNYSGANCIAEINILFVLNLPRSFSSKMIQLARAVNSSGMDIAFRDDFGTNKIYTGKWINATDFSENSELLSNGTMTLKCYKIEDI